MTLRFPDLPADHPANNVRPEMLYDNNQFAPKLTVPERCGVAAALLLGFSSRHIARSFDLDRRTVTRLLNANGKQYQSIRNEVDKLGKQPFIAKYFTQAISDRLTATTVLADDVEQAAPKNTRPNPRAKGEAGISAHKGPNHTYTHRIEVKWCVKDQTTVNGEGWWVKQLDVDGINDDWLGDDEGKPFHTSSAALQYARRWLDENV